MHVIARLVALVPKPRVNLMRLLRRFRAEQSASCMIDASQSRTVRMAALTFLRSLRACSANGWFWHFAA